MEFDPNKKTESRLTEEQSAYIDKVFEENPEIAEAFENAKVFFEHDPSQIILNEETGQIESHGHKYMNSPRMRSFVLRANAIRNSLPPVEDGYLRLWRGNREGEIGQNPSFTSSLEGIAMPFLNAYGGKFSYLDIPLDKYNDYVQTGLVVPDAEFRVPPEIAATAIEITEPKEENARQNAKELFQKYIDQGGSIDGRKILQWLSTTTLENL
ncbi:MAG TPA: hypothetical protein PK950_02660 [Candidatus Paceibacterota bacterium]|nr:hypothetical protein [Candidatus Paceibacterota bacterium]